MDENNYKIITKKYCGFNTHTLDSYFKKSKDVKLAFKNRTATYYNIGYKYFPISYKKITINYEIWLPNWGELNLKKRDFLLEIRNYKNKRSIHWLRLCKQNIPMDIIREIYEYL